MSKKDKIAAKSGDNKVNETENSEKKDKVSNKINDGKCCRCVYRNSEKKCACKKSENLNKYVARKGGCNCFKYND